eukprot:TRINITY_DN35280_c0_g1_i1.p1 TRINITY_DN35280_c0_g1~~TRINITY_DN35280_c0_g1_i1.p1  ORF type:complete len:251 (+),score=15.10 TRINITY_DN35280_c0_g1_i1:111-755(+)
MAVAATPCVTCGVKPSLLDSARLAAWDRKLMSDVVAFETVENDARKAGLASHSTLDMHSRTSMTNEATCPPALAPLHPHHHLTRRIARWKCRAFASIGDLEGVVNAVRLEEEAWHVLKASPSREWAQCREALGDAILALCASRGVVRRNVPSARSVVGDVRRATGDTRRLLQEACHCFEFAAEIMRLGRGPRGFARSRIVHKLKEARRSLSAIP